MLTHVYVTPKEKEEGLRLRVDPEVQLDAVLER